MYANAALAWIIFTICCTVRGSDFHCIGSRDFEILDILLYRITVTDIGHTTLRIIFIVSYIYDHLMYWMYKRSLEKIQPRALETEQYIKLFIHTGCKQ